MSIETTEGYSEAGYVELLETVVIGIGGCRIDVRFSISKVPGLFYITSGIKDKPTDFVPDSRHVVHPVVFGSGKKKFDPIGGMLTGRDLVAYALENSKPDSMHDYVVHLVRTSYRDARNSTHFTYQFANFHREAIRSLTRKAPQMLIRFRYKWSPYMVKYSHKDKPIMDFFTKMLANTGGAAAVIYFLEQMIFAITSKLRSIRKPDSNNAPPAKDAQSAAQRCGPVGN